MSITPRGLLLSCLSAACLLACKKSHVNDPPIVYSHTGAPGTMVFSQASLKKGEPLLVSLSGGTVTSTAIRWSVWADSTRYHLVPAKSKAMVLFARPGSFMVKAYSLGADSTVQDSSWKWIHVSDTVYQPGQPANSNTVSLAGGDITLMPEVDSNANLYFLAETKLSYGCSSTLVDQVDTGGNNARGIEIDFDEAIANGTGLCNGVQNPASGYLFPGATSSWAGGSYPLTVTINGTTYLGSLTVTGSKYTFNWNYTSGVIISPLQINR